MKTHGVVALRPCRLTWFVIPPGSYLCSQVGGTWYVVRVPLKGRVCVPLPTWLTWYVTWFIAHEPRRLKLFGRLIEVIQINSGVLATDVAADRDL
jgi:hypothetical protein